MPTLPGATTTLANLSEWSQPIFTAMWPYAMFAGGVILGIGLIVLVIKLASLAASHMKGH